jgi:hypothetical protein
MVLKQLHNHGKASVNGPDLAVLEMAQIKAQVNEEREMSTGYLHIFRTPHLRNRALFSIITWLMGQSTGILIIANLTPLLFANLGFDTVLQLGLSVVWAGVALVGCVINAVLMDRVGRVRLLGQYLLHPFRDDLTTGFH